MWSFTQGLRKPNFLTIQTQLDMKAKVFRRAYQRIRQADLASFARNTLNRTKEVPEYAFLQTEATALATTLQQYETALAAARNRGMAEVAVKNEAQKSLLAALDKIADALDLKADSSPTLLSGAGFTLQQPSARFSGHIAVPEVLRLGSTGRKGELRVQLSDEMPGAVLTHAMEYSEDKGTSWKNGTYQNRNHFVVGGLPASPELLFRFKSVGRGDNKSHWTEPVVAGVL